MGGRDLENNTMEVMPRYTLEKETVTCDGIETYVQKLLEEIQPNIYKKHWITAIPEITTLVDTYEDFRKSMLPYSPDQTATQEDGTSGME